MDKNLNEFGKMSEDITEEVTEAAEETVEAAEELAQETEEAAAEVAAAAEDVAEAAEEVIEEAAEITEPAIEAAAPKSKAKAMIAVVAAVVIVAVAMITSTMEFNKYNRLGYVDISGKTVQDLIDAQGMELSEFLEMYGLPEDMPADTTEAAAYYSIPAGKIAEMYGMDFETLKTTLNIPAEVTEETTWGEAEGEIALINYVGESNIDSFKAEYGLGDEVTGETKWKELRAIVDTKQKEAREAQEAEAAAAAAEAETADDAETETEAGAEGDAAGETEETTEE